MHLHIKGRTKRGHGRGECHCRHERNKALSSNQRKRPASTNQPRDNFLGFIKDTPPAVLVGSCIYVERDGWEWVRFSPNVRMVSLRYPYGQRSAFHFFFWPLEADPRGWTFFQLDRRDLSVWPENELYHPGDFAIHTHDDRAMRAFSIYRQMYWREQRQQQQQQQPQQRANDAEMKSSGTQGG